MSVKVFKYRLVPTRAQKTKLKGILAACRWVYNKALEVRKQAWEERKESIGHYDTINMLTQWKKENPFLKRAHSQVLCEVCTRVDLAFKHFFRRYKNGEKPGYPRFKGKGWYKSFTYPQSGYRLIDNHRLYLSKIGEVKIKLHRPLEGTIKRLTIKRDWLGNWYACFVVDFEPSPLPPTDKIVGIDLGCEKFATLSTGEEVPNPRFFRRDEKALAKAQRRLSQCKKESKEYKQRKRVVQHIHQRIKNRRTDFAHKLSRELVNAFQILVFEKLDIKGMQNDNWRLLNKSISDVAWGQLVALTSYKAEWAGRTFLTVAPKGTTQMCSGCGEIVPKDLNVRVHNCPRCGLVIDRDLNAARNILARGLACLA